MSKNRITVITVVYNGEASIEKTILSVIKQTSFRNFEYVIIDGGSGDSTLQIIEKYKTSIDVVISERDRGIYDAMNKGADIASGKWLVYMNSGDTFADEHVVQKFCNAGLDYEGNGIIYGDIILNSPGRKKISQNKKNLLYDSICHQSQFIKKDLLLSFGGYDIQYKIYADFHFQLRVYLKDKSLISHFPMIICEYDSNGVSGKAFGAYLKEYLSLGKAVLPNGLYNRYLFNAYKKAIFSFLSIVKARIKNRR